MAQVTQLFEPYKSLVRQLSLLWDLKKNVFFFIYYYYFSSASFCLTFDGEQNTACCQAFTGNFDLWSLWSLWSTFLPLHSLLDSVRSGNEVINRARTAW